MSEDHEGFARRWSRRKVEARQSGDQAGETPAAAPEKEPPAEPDDSGGSEAAPLPDIETLDAASDFTQFMRPDVPKAIRNAALRRLWGLDPVLANLDGLLEYGEDFTDSAKVVEGLKTAYRVGRGFARSEEEEQAGPPPAETQVAEAGEQADTSEEGPAPDQRRTNSDE